MNLIFSLARCGSTTLMRLLEAAEPSKKWFNEPFSRINQPARNAVAHLPHGIPTTVERLREDGIFGIKHVWWNDGPFDEDRNVQKNLELISECSQVVVLTRGNSLRRSVSREISKQSGNWVCSREARDSIKFHRFDPVDPKSIEQEMFAERKMRGLPDQLCKNLGLPFHSVTYEQLFERADPYMAHDMAWVGHLFGLNLPNNLHDRFQFLRAEQSKMNSAETYRLIPNIDEIEERFGSNENGWLFKE